MFILRLGREAEADSYYFILSHIKQSQSKCIGSPSELNDLELIADTPPPFIKSSFTTSCVCELECSFVCFCEVGV